MKTLEQIIVERMEKLEKRYQESTIDFQSNKLYAKLNILESVLKEYREQK